MDVDNASKFTLVRGAFVEALATIEPASIPHATRALQALLRCDQNTNSSHIEIAARLCSATHQRCPALHNASLSLVASDLPTPPGAPARFLAQKELTALQSDLLLRRYLSESSCTVQYIDAGCQTNDSHPIPAPVLSFRIGGEEKEGPPTSLQAAEDALHTGVAIAFSQIEAGHNLLVLGQVKTSGKSSSLAVITAATESITSDQNEHKLSRSCGSRFPPVLDILSKVGRYDIGVLAGILVGAASQRVPVLVGGHAAIAATLLGQAFHPQLKNSVFASHASSDPEVSKAIAFLGLSPIVPSPPRHPYEQVRAIEVMRNALSVLQTAYMG